MHAALSLNSGSSSIKFALYQSESKQQQPALICRGELSDLPHHLQFTAENASEQMEDQCLQGPTDFKKALGYLLDWINRRFPEIQLTAAGHRIVHGGERFTKSTIIDEDILKYLETLTPLAPQHQPHNIAGVRTMQALHPSLPQIACFDTAFHHTQPRLATLFALPAQLSKQGIRRFGFHGLSYQYISSQLKELMGEMSQGKVVIAHLGHGASMCAIKDLESIATTMGLTALDGLPMGTRCGSIDPGAVTYLLSEKGLSVQEVNDLLYNQSGLLGISGVSDDMKELLASSDPQAREAIDYFCYRIQRELGSLVAALGGLDALVFTGGIGENAAPIRQQVCKGLDWLNIEIDPNRNNVHLQTKAIALTAPAQHPSVWVIPTNEEIVIAQDVFDLILS